MSVQRIFESAGVVVLLLGMSVLSACGGESATDSDAGARSPSELAAHLVTEQDLGEGWTIVANPETETKDDPGVITDANRDTLPRIEFCDKAGADSRAAALDLKWGAFRQLNLATPTEAAQPTDRPSDDTTRPEHDLVFVQEFLMSGTTAEIRSAYDALAAGVQACWGVTTEYPDGEVGTSESLQVPTLGDERVGSRDIVTEPGPGTEAGIWDLRSVIARDGNVLVGVTIAEVTTPAVEPVLDDAQIARILTTIVDRL